MAIDENFLYASLQPLLVLFTYNVKFTMEMIIFKQKTSF